MKFSMFSQPPKHTPRSRTGLPSPSRNSLPEVRRNAEAVTLTPLSRKFRSETGQVSHGPGYQPSSASARRQMGREELQRRGLVVRTAALMAVVAPEQQLLLRRVGVVGGEHGRRRHDGIHQRRREQ